jgi:hypothetical protein
MVLCDQWCGTSVHFVNGIPHNDRDNKPHKCSQAERAREFEGYYNMIQIGTIKPMLQRVEYSIAEAQASLKEFKRMLDYVEEKNKPLAKAFVARKEKGRKRNQQQPKTEAKPEIKIASELLTK